MTMAQNRQLQLLATQRKKNPKRNRKYNHETIEENVERFSVEKIAHRNNLWDTGKKCAQPKFRLYELCTAYSWGITDWNEKEFNALYRIDM